MGAVEAITSERTYTSAEVRRLLDDIERDAKAYGLEMVVGCLGRVGLRARENGQMPEAIEGLSKPVDPADYYGPVDAIAAAIRWMTLDEINHDPKTCRRLRMALSDVWVLVNRA